MDTRVVIPCPGCRLGLRVPSDQGNLVVKCPKCASTFEWEPSAIPSSSSNPLVPLTSHHVARRRAITAGVLVVVALIVGLLVSAARRPRWISISYRDLIDASVITHSGKTVGELLSGLGNGQNAANVGELQPYVEKFSFVCNDVVGASHSDGEQPSVSAVADFPPGSTQPAWAALVREGRYQVFVGETRARLFLQGTDPTGLFERDHGVIRHALLAALNRAGREKIDVEVYAFENVYATQTIRLDLKPVKSSVSRTDLQPKGTTLSLTGLAGLLATGGPLEAAEIDSEGQLRLYARRAGRETLADVPQSVADLAAVYRAVFHSGKNPPYISLDKDEDNRRAKVNFGGLLEDTHVGYVVLEADKLFKTISTGLDPNSRENVIASVREFVPDFLTGHERSLGQLRSSGSARETIRYWFYPDKIRTVTDGGIGAIETYQFFADAERMGEATLGPAQRATMDHLNSHFEAYAKRFQPFRELSTVGRMMAIVNWLHSAGAAARADLDGLLGVELPPFSTQRSTEKMLAIAAVGIAQYGGREERGKVTVIRLDELLGRQAPETSDDEFLSRALAAFRLRDHKDLLPSSVLALRSSQSEMDRDLKNRQAELESLGAQIEQRRVVLDGTDEGAVLSFNALVGRYEALRRSYNSDVAAFNAKSERFASMTSVRPIASVGGGISLEPLKFARPIAAPNSPKLRALRAVANGVPDPHAAIVRSDAPKNSSVAPSRDLSWQRESGPEVVDARWRRADSASASLRRSSDGQSQYWVRTPQYFADGIVKPSERSLFLASSQYPTEVVVIGEIAAGRTILLRRGKAIESSPERPVWPTR